MNDTYLASRRECVLLSANFLSTVQVMENYTAHVLHLGSRPTTDLCNISSLQLCWQRLIPTD
jgi:hypothetical protein